ncbi:unnamed protein product [Cylicostephanus goldi]|uniref:Band 3 cytoplasmic domain-containing protein n=1 Tax=Cylicostephanus goldi TaxID=71465 RepID=A0A3P7MUH5_CYLGO|nr:unnamed protein product [Cylicostephanus goldi]
MLAFWRPLAFVEKLYPAIPDLPIPIRFLFILLSPKENYEKERISIGRTIGSLLSDEIFRKVALHTLEPFTIADAADEFISQIVAVPPGVCSTETRWEPRETEIKRWLYRVDWLRSSTIESAMRKLGIMPLHKQTRSVGMLYATYPDHELEDEEVEESHGGIVRTGKLFGGLCQDIK